MYLMISMLTAPAIVDEVVTSAGIILLAILMVFKQLTSSNLKFLAYIYIQLLSG